MKDLSADSYPSLVPLFLWFDQVMALVSVLATLLANTLFILAAKEVQGAIVLRAGSELCRRQLRGRVAPLWPSVRQDLQVHWHGRRNSRGGPALQAVGS